MSRGGALTLLRWLFGAGIACVLCSANGAWAYSPCALPLDLTPIETFEYRPGKFGVTMLLDRSTSMFTKVQGKKTRWLKTLESLQHLSEFFEKICVSEVHFQTVPVVDTPPFFQPGECPALSASGASTEIATGAARPKLTLNLKTAPPSQISVSRLKEILKEYSSPTSTRDQGTPLYSAIEASLERVENNPGMQFVIISDGDDDPWTCREKKYLLSAKDLKDFNSTKDIPSGGASCSLSRLEQKCPVSSSDIKDSAIAKLTHRQKQERELIERLKKFRDRIRLVDVGTEGGRLSKKLEHSAFSDNRLMETTLTDAVRTQLCRTHRKQQLIAALGLDVSAEKNFPKSNAASCDPLQKLAETCEKTDVQAEPLAVKPCEEVWEHPAYYERCHQYGTTLDRIWALAASLDSAQCQERFKQVTPESCAESLPDAKSPCRSLHELRCAVFDRRRVLEEQVHAIARSGGLSLENIPTPGVVAVGNEAGYHCSGVLVSQRAVLTARHCLPASRVLLGQSLREPSTEVRVTQAVPAPGTVDAALLRLVVPVNAPTVERRPAGESSPPLRRLRLAGFGSTRTSGGRDFGREHSTDLPGQSTWGCDAQRARWAGCNPASEMVIAQTGGRDTCDGDSGGPVFELLTQGAGMARMCQWRLLAITSRPIASAHARCGEGGGYTRVDTLEQWIAEVLAGWNGSLDAGKAP